MGRNWSQQEWRAFEQKTARAIVAGSCPDDQWKTVVRSARRVLQNYSSSFFIVTRFLPQATREQVEVIYAAVRFPDEIVDTFPIQAVTALAHLDRWQADYERGLASASFAEAIHSGVNCFAAAFAEVVKKNGIPPEYYRSFLSAMRADVAPRPFSTLDDLIESYVYGSAIVVGYFLAHVYGPSAPGEFPRALQASRELGIALQLTNFLRDIEADRQRGRLYLPAMWLDPEDRQERSLDRASRRLSAEAARLYIAAEKNLDAFAPDCRVAIQACIDVYRELNARIGSSSEGIHHRERVPMGRKFRVLPQSKYWRLPLAYLGAI